jgi:hypothetical protein
MMCGMTEAQVYLDASEHQPGNGMKFAVRAAFDRVHFAAGQSSKVTLHVPIRSILVCIFLARGAQL